MAAAIDDDALRRIAALVATMRTSPPAARPYGEVKAIILAALEAAPDLDFTTEHLREVTLAKRQVVWTATSELVRDDLIERPQFGTFRAKRRAV